MYAFLALITAITVLSGCATTPRTPGTGYPSLERKTVTPKGTYHKVTKGETLWRISKTYDIDINKIVAANNLNDCTKISPGQLIFIPQITSLKPKMEKVAKNNGLNYFIWPVEGKVLSFFGIKKTDSTINRGIDILTKEGSNVLATRAGKVIFCSDKIKGFGKTIILEHDDDLFSVYANNSLILVNIGQSVQQGDLIAKVGKTERASNYVLHFEIRKGHVPQNPFYFLP